MHAGSTPPNTWPALTQPPSQNIASHRTRGRALPSVRAGGYVATDTEFALWRSVGTGLVWQTIFLDIRTD
jgi:hypothetical protein